MGTAGLVRLALVSVTLVWTACTGTPRQRNVEGRPVDTGPGTLTAARKYLEGRWTLVSFQIFSAGKPPTQVKGAGTLSYDAFGNLNMEVRVDDATARMLELEGISTTQGVLSTTGRTVVDLDSRTLTYVLEGQPLLAPAGGPLSPRRPRHWEVSGNTLTLTTRGDDGTTVSEARWEKTP